jgi:hypothetical protein
VNAAAAAAAPAPVPAVAVSTASKPNGTPVPVWTRQLEFTGLRLQNSTVKCLVVNHGKLDTPLLHLLVTLRSSRGTSEPPVGTFKVHLSPLGSGNSREIAEPILFTPPMRSIDWSDLKAELQVLKP